MAAVSGYKGIYGGSQRNTVKYVIWSFYVLSRIKLWGSAAQVLAQPKLPPWRDELG